MTLRIIICLSLFCLLASTANAQGNAEKGIGLGGAAGAIIGGIIGNQSDQSAEGALIGGALGAIAGGAIGSSKDEEIRRVQEYQWRQQQQYRAQQQYQEQLQRAVSMSDVISLTRSGVSDTVIIGQIQKGGVTNRVGVAEIIELHQQGVRENVITAMQRAPLAGEVIASRPRVAPSLPTIASPTRTRVIIQPRPVVVERYHVAPPCPNSVPFYRHARHHYHFHR